MVNVTIYMMANMSDGLKYKNLKYETNEHNIIGFNPKRKCHSNQIFCKISILIIKSTSNTQMLIRYFGIYNQ